MLLRAVGHVLLLTVLAMAIHAPGAGAQADQNKNSGGYAVLEITFEVDRKPDGAKYPAGVMERYTLKSDGMLEYSATFVGIPKELKNKDTANWDAGKHATNVLDAVQQVLGDPYLVAGLKEMSNGAPTPSAGEGVYTVQVEKDQQKSTRLLKDRKSPAYAQIHTAFSALIGEFEKATGRPLNPAQLAQ